MPQIGICGFQISSCCYKCVNVGQFSGTILLYEVYQCSAEHSSHSEIGRDVNRGLACMYVMLFSVLPSRWWLFICSVGSLRTQLTGESLSLGLQEILHVCLILVVVVSMDPNLSAGGFEAIFFHFREYNELSYEDTTRQTDPVVCTASQLLTWPSQFRWNAAFFHATFCCLIMIDD